MDNKGGIKPAIYRRRPEEHEIIDQEVEELLSKGLIRESSSSYLSPVVVIPKKDGSKRFCIDYRKLNKITIKEEFPIPRVDDALDALGGAKYFTSLDLESGYH